MKSSVESREFRRLARNNCYTYDCLDVCTSNDVCLEAHTFPQYRLDDNGSSLEKFIGLIQGLANQATGNDSSSKLTRLIPTVKWQGDNLYTDISLNGVMYFLDYADYIDTKKKLQNLIKRQGWLLESSTFKEVAFASYKPAMNAGDALYGDDPIDAAGMAMMANAVRHGYAEMKVAYGMATKNVEDYAEGKAKLAGAKHAECLGLAGFGFTDNIEAGYEAFATNTSAAIVLKWSASGSRVTLKIDGQAARHSINMVMTRAEFTEGGFVVDDTSNNSVYPTQMDVSISLTNMYGALLSAANTKNSISDGTSKGLKDMAK